jgi:hypothetical protein
MNKTDTPLDVYMEAEQQVLAAGLKNADVMDMDFDHQVDIVDAAIKLLYIVRTMYSNTHYLGAAGAIEAMLKLRIWQEKQLKTKL